MMGYFAGVGVLGIEIGEYHDGEAVVDIARDVGGEALPGAAVLEQFVAVRLIDTPAEAVGRVFAVAEGAGRPHLVEARFLKKLFGVEGGIPLFEIEDGEIHRAVGRGIEAGDTHS